MGHPRRTAPTSVLSVMMSCMLVALMLRADATMFDVHNTLANMRTFPDEEILHDHPGAWYDPDIFDDYSVDVTTCMSEDHHAYMLFGNDCSGKWSHAKEGGRKKHTKQVVFEVLQGCAWWEEYESWYSTKPGLGFGFPGLGNFFQVLRLVFSFIPGVGVGTVMNDGKQRDCQKSEPWTISNACARAIVADLAPVYRYERSYSLHALLFSRNIAKRGEENTAWRSQDGCGIHSSLSGVRESILQKRLTNPKAVCWDFIADFQLLYCESQLEQSHAPYKELCSYSDEEWTSLKETEAVAVVKRIDDFSQNYLHKPGVLPQAMEAVNKFIRHHEAPTRIRKRHATKE